MAHTNKSDGLSCFACLVEHRVLIKAVNNNVIKLAENCVVVFSAIRSCGRCVVACWTGFRDGSNRFLFELKSLYLSQSGSSCLYTLLNTERRDVQLKTGRCRGIEQTLVVRIRTRNVEGSIMQHSKLDVMRALSNAIS